MAIDVTPQELRDIEIREAWRGYHRDDVDELLERAAATVEHLQDHVRQLQSRAPSAPAPAAAPAPPTRAPGVDTDVIQRTLILAQKAADEAVAEARSRAEHLLEESEAKAQALVSDAEATARRIAESERQRIEADIRQLTATRDALNADVDALERFEREYRERLRRAIEAELEYLGSVQGSPSDPRPQPQDVSLLTDVGGLLRDDDASGPSRVAEAGGTRRDEREPASVSTSWDLEPPGGWGEPQTAEPQTAMVVDDTGEQALPSRAGPGPADEAHPLDDDAFFASLREAVRDEAPLGPGDRGQYDFEDDEPDDRRGLFRRRR